tara:strand:+ start:2450 stop:3511 length:1062 start_codon:yes stop_codon:yes gene_type:complete
MSQMTDEQMGALANLVGELKLSPVIAIPESNVDNNVPANIARPLRSTRYSGSYAEPDLRKRLGGKKSRKMRGGGKCEDNWYVNMAVNSAIVMSGTAAAIGVGYGGYAALAHFMDAFGLDETVKASVETIYQTGMAIGKTVGTAGASAASGAMDIAGSAVSGLKSAAPAFGKAAGSVAYTGAMAGPLVALGRYVGTEQSARDDLQGILSRLESQYTDLTNKIGTVTRSMVSKKEQYSSQIHDIRTKIEEYNNNTHAVAAVAKKNTTDNFNSLKRSLCNAIDRGMKTKEDIENIFNPYYGMNIAFGGKRRKRSSTRRSKSRNSRSTSKGRKSGNKSKKMKGKRGKRSVKRRSSKR